MVKYSVKKVKIKLMELNFLTLVLKIEYVKIQVGLYRKALTVQRALIRLGKKCGVLLKWNG